MTLRQLAAPPTSTGTGAVLSCRGLRKSYDGRLAVDGVSFDIGKGETYGLLGPNGAGKTTVISMVVGILPPDAGDIRVAGLPMTLRALAAKSRIGYVPQEIAVYPDLTGRENLRLFARLYGLRAAAARARAEEVLEVVGLSGRAGDRAGTYSGGMQRRLNIGAGLLHRPDLLILDEPTVGVDPQSRNAILDDVTALSGRGVAVLYTTHYMEEAHRLCDRVGIIDAGRLVAQGTQRELTALVGQCDRVRLGATGDLASAGEALERLGSVRGIAVGADGIELLDTDARTALPAILAAVSGAGATVRSVTLEEPDLEAVFLHLTGRSLRD
ncbi:putative ABC transporter ATP-binding protein YfiL [Virgisporangium aliadipatigenens]|uniref:Putative ABC transporter ATP-binding protein YfiL n=1 Tax=Virgisporangium aliadipatigenens TaxID=741659 RepID=A0A8J3YQR6_9ACTN|nr:ABC transporter ATP-binding protein [Virgisporangium aliadipatigenens]GIJ48083.1 putative ABC transporter ATP-binding protein YfiL [Virgisporangium aliadipatigenens]